MRRFKYAAEILYCMERGVALGIFLLIFVGGIFVTAAFTLYFQQPIEKLTVWLVFGELVSGGGLVYVEALEFYLEQPSVEVTGSLETRRARRTNVSVIVSDVQIAQIRQLELLVRVGQSIIKEAELLVSVQDRRGVLPSVLRSSAPVAWKSEHFEHINLGKVRPRHDNLPKRILAKAFNQYERKLKSGTDNFAVLLFTIEGHTDAYLTTSSKDLRTLPIGYRYVLDVNLIGENMIESHRESFYLELYNWNDMIFGYPSRLPLHLLRRWLNRRPILRSRTRVVAEEQAQERNIPATTDAIPRAT